MNRVFLGVIAAFVLIGAVLLYQANKAGTSLVLLPSDLEKKGPAETLTRIRVGGRVAALPVQYKVEPEIELRFTIEDPGSGMGKIPVVYNSLKPDMFSPGRDVIIDGEYRGGTLIAHKLLTQCPSKYEPPSPDKKTP